MEIHPVEREAAAAEKSMPRCRRRARILSGIFHGNHLVRRARAPAIPSRRKCRMVKSDGKRTDCDDPSGGRGLTRQPVHVYVQAYLQACAMSPLLDFALMNHSALMSNSFFDRGALSILPQNIAKA